MSGTYPTAPQSRQRKKADILCQPLELSGGDVRIRTGDKGFAGLCLTTWPRRHMLRAGTRPALCIAWSGLRGSNPRPQPWQGCALPTALSPRAGINIRKPPTECKNFFAFFGKKFAATRFQAFDLRILSQMVAITFWRQATRFDPRRLGPASHSTPLYRFDPNVLSPVCPESRTWSELTWPSPPSGTPRGRGEVKVVPNRGLHLDRGD